jgi:hypothetical protein
LSQNTLRNSNNPNLGVEVVSAPVIEPGTGEKNSDNLCFDGYACLIVPRHPLGRVFEQCGIISQAKILLANGILV